MKQLAYIISIFIIIILASSCGSKQAHIVGKIDGVKNSQIIMASDDKMEHIDTISVKDGKFVYDIKLTEPTPLYMILKESGENLLVFAENGTINIDSKLGDFKNANIKGGKSQDELNIYTKSVEPLMQKGLELRHLGEKATATQDIENIQHQFDALDSTETELMKTFIKAHPTSPVSSFLASAKIGNEENIDRFQSIYSLLSGTALTTVYGLKLTGIYSKLNALAIGGASKDFTLPDVNGKQISLNSFKGKYVLLDFWASWCKPCRAENPNVVAAYNSFKDKNFEVLSVSLDDKKEAWLDAIKQDNLTWTQVSDLTGWSCKAAEMYGIQSIPTNFLLDKEGKIIGKNLRGEALSAKLASILK